MSDFHRSLDRALDHDPHTDWGIRSEDLMPPLAELEIPAEGTE